MSPHTDYLTKRLHPINIVFKLFSLGRSMLFPIIFLFIIKHGSDSAFTKYGRIAIILFMVISIVGILLNWFTHRYEFEERTLHIYHGVFVKSHRNVPLSRIQNIQKHTTFLHRMFNLTSITLETGTSGDEASVKFDVISYKEAERIEQLVATLASDQLVKENAILTVDKMDDEEPGLLEKTMHYTVSNTELVKASFTSLSFVAIIPIVVSIYFNIDEFFSLEDATGNLFSIILDKLWILIPLTLAFLLVSISIGLLTTFLRYGKSEISSDTNRIYLKKGILNVTSFSITKNKVQAIQFEQSLLKRLFGFVEVKLVSAGSVGDDKQETNSLFPFLPIKQAYALVEILLPHYQINPDMHKLPKKSLGLKILRPNYFWIIGSIILFYWKPEFWYASPILLAIILVYKYLVFYRTRYLLSDYLVQIKTGAFTTTLFITDRHKIQEIEVKQSVLQRKFGLANIQMANRGKPTHISNVDDLPQSIASCFYHWYAARPQNTK